MTVDIKELSDKYYTTLQQANEVLDGWDPRTRPGKEMMKTRAKERLVELSKQYVNAVKKAAVGILVTGPVNLVEDFEAIAQDEGNTINVNSQDLYNRLSKDVYKAIGGDKILNGLQAHLLNLTLEELSEEIDITLTKKVNITKNYIIKSQEQLTGVLKTIIRQFVGDELNALYIEHKTAVAAIKQRYSSNVVPVVVSGASEDEVEGLSNVLFGGNTTDVVLKEDLAVTKDVVLGVFSTLKEQIKGGKEPKKRGRPAKTNKTTKQ